MPFPAATQAEGVQDLKAAFVYSFSKLVTWPASSWEGDRAPLRICLVEGDPNLASFAGNLAGRTVGEHPVEVVAVPPAGAPHCQVVFLGSALESSYPNLMATFAQPSVLLVDEGRHFSWTHGMIRLFVEDDRMSFEINLDTMEHAGLRADPRLIRLARIATR